MERNVVFIALFAALVAALGLIPAIHISSVPITAQSLGIMLCGTVLGAKRGALAALLFIVLVAIGLPLLAGGRGGIGLFAGPSAGFLIGFPVAAFVTGFIVEQWKSVPITASAMIASLLGGIVVLYLFGIPGMAMALDKSLVDATKLIVAYIPGDIIKAVIAGILTGALYKARPQSILSQA